MHSQNLIYHLNRSPYLSALTLDPNGSVYRVDRHCATCLSVGIHNLV